MPAPIEEVRLIFPHQIISCEFFATDACVYITKSCLQGDGDVKSWTANGWILARDGITSWRDRNQRGYSL